MDETATAKVEGGDGAGGGTMMRTLKIVLSVMGLLIVAGFAYIGYEVWRRTNDPEYRAAIEAERAARRAPAPASEGVMRARAPVAPLELPPGAIITDTVAVGTLLAVTVERIDGTQTLYVIDPRRGDLVEFLRTQPRGR
jgi:hypothetical protein